MRKCPKCNSEVFKSMEPKIANLANINSKFLKQTEFWRCGNEICGYKEKV